MPKVPFPIDKREWHPSLIPGVIALVSTISKDGAPNVAPKSFIQMVSIDPPILMFSGSQYGMTEKNIADTKCFALNIVDGGMAQRTYDCVKFKGAERIEKSGFTLVNATSIDAPLVSDCQAHLECRLRDTKEIGSGFVVFGEIVAASINADILEQEPRARYSSLDMTVYLEEGLYAAIDQARPAVTEKLSEHTTRWVYLLTHQFPSLFTKELVRAHVAHLKKLEEQGLLELCGPFPEHGGGIVILRNVTKEQAAEIAEADPFVSSGAETFELRKLEVSCRENNHLGMG